MTSRLVNIMSTSDVERLVLVPQQSSEPAGRPGTEIVPTGLPDPAMLARMANDFFTALPDGIHLPLREVPGNFSKGEAPVTAPAFPPEISLPSNPHFQTAPASAGPASASPVSAPVQATPPAIPGIAGAATGLSQAPGGISSVSFLQAIRPIF